MKKKITLARRVITCTSYPTERECCRLGKQTRCLHCSLSFYFCLFLFLDLCRHLKFTTPVDGYVLEGHVIKNVSLSVGMRGSCKGRCTIESKCLSFNIGPPIKDNVLCQLSDSDHTLHPEDLKPREGFTYRGTEVMIILSAVA